jgi:adenylosuccinate synthase
MKQAEVIIPLVSDVSARLAELQKQGKPILFEGAQGGLLDLDLGTYPYVTSSNTTAGAASTGSGFGPCGIDEVLGVTKAYTTRVGSGPFPSEEEGPLGLNMAERGKEFGSVTGRPRRCGWLDLVVLRRSLQASSVTQLVLTKVDVLDEMTELKLCVAYELNGKRITLPPYDSDLLAECKPIYDTMPGWHCNTYGLTDQEQLPEALNDYITRIEAELGIPVVIVSTGPDRKETIRLHGCAVV